MRLVIGLVFYCISVVAMASYNDTGTSVYSDSKVYCVKFYPTSTFHGNVVQDAGVSVSCVSAASIQKDILEMEVLKLQKTKLENELTRHSKLKK